MWGQYNEVKPDLKHNPGIDEQNASIICRAKQWNQAESEIHTGVIWRNQGINIQYRYKKVRLDLKHDIRE
jgi:hypothetical protein